MTSNIEKNPITDEFFPYKNMTVQERNYYLNILNNCKDICDSENKVDNQGKCEIIELRLLKENRIVVFNGSLFIGTEEKHENRCIRGEIYLKKNEIFVDMHVTRLCSESENKIYTVLDQFKLENDVLKRRSQYNYNLENINDEIESEEIKERLR